MKLQENAINTLRVMSLHTITKAKSGHPGIALGSAPLLFALYSNGAFFYPQKEYFNRDRIVLSAGHVSALFYNIFYCLNYGVSKQDLLSFRQLDSVTSGHPETHLFGVEAGTGPLGQGIANAVGMAIAEKHLQSKFNMPDCEIINHKVFAFCGDGCLMEGVSQEALSLAGNLKLDNLIVLYDYNHTTIDGYLGLTQSENIVKKYKALNFNVMQVKNGNNYEKILKAIKKARTLKGKPTIIIVHTIIGFSSCFENLPKAHGTALTQEQIKEVENKLDVSFNNFEPDAILKNYFAIIHNTQKQHYNSWKQRLEEYKKNYPEKYNELEKYLKASFEINENELIRFASENQKQEATKSSHSLILNKVIQFIPNFLGGCADVKKSTKAYIESDNYFSPQSLQNRNIAFGVREHAMGSICNGIALYGGFNTFCSTFLSFSDYMRPSIRMACLQNLPCVFAFTHDSIGAGEDGPTHQPVEQLNSLRIMPNCTVFRPCDINEIAGSYLWFLKNKKPTVISLTRQEVGVIKNTNALETLKGAYIVKPESKNKKLNAVIIATGSEVEIALKTAQILEENKKNIRVISMPSISLFDRQTKEYKQKLLPENIEIISIEAGNTECFKKYASQTFGVNEFGKSGTAKQLYKHFNLTPEKIAKNIKLSE